MKVAMFVLAVIVAALVVGCGRDEMVSLVGPSKPITQPKVLEIKVMVEIPQTGEVSKMYELNGRVTYTLTPARGELAKGSVGKEYYDLTIATEAELKQVGSPETEAVKVSGNSTHRIALDDNLSTSVVRQYRIESMGGNTYLNLEFKADPTELLFAGAWVSGGEGQIP